MKWCQVLSVNRIYQFSGPKSLLACVRVCAHHNLSWILNSFSLLDTKSQNLLLCLFMLLYFPHFVSLPLSLLSLFLSLTSPSLSLLISLCFSFHLSQWFSTGVPRNPRVPWKALRVPPNFWTCCLFTGKLQLGVPPNCSIRKEGCRESKKVENHWSKHSNCVHDLFDCVK